jgi:predicted dehydrogenase
LRGFLNHGDCQVRLICDLDRHHAEQGAQLVNDAYKTKDCALVPDFREAVRRSDIDAFLIGTPDHWHALTAIEALNAGKDVYLEKPLALTFEEGKAVRAAVRRKKRVFQLGTQQRSGRMFRFASELALNGKLGKLHTINVWAPGSPPGGSTTHQAPPESLDYKMWLGPAPVRPYTENLCSDNDALKTWWYVSDFTVGFLTGWGIHPMDIALWGADDLMKGSVTVQGRGNYRAAEGICDTASIWETDYEFSSGLKMKFVGVPNGGNRGKDTGEPSLYKDEWTKRYRRIETHGTAFEGSEGWAHVDRTGINLQPENLIDLSPDDFATKLPRSSDHARNFLDCVKSRQDPVSNVDAAVKGDALCQAADIAMRLGRKLTLDMRHETFVRDEAANERLSARIQKPWRLA